MGRGLSQDASVGTVARRVKQTPSSFKDRLMACIDTSVEKQQICFQENGIRVSPQVLMLGQTIKWLRISRESSVSSSSGKYLFFSTDPSNLAQLAESEIESGAFDEAKISVHPSDEWNEYCLCLYADRDKQASVELEARWPQIKFRGWKSDEDSQADMKAKLTADRA